MSQANKTGLDLLLETVCRTMHISDLEKTKRKWQTLNIHFRRITLNIFNKQKLCTNKAIVLLIAIELAAHKIAQTT